MTRNFESKLMAYDDASKEDKKALSTDKREVYRRPTI